MSRPTASHANDLRQRRRYAVPDAGRRLSHREMMAVLSLAMRTDSLWAAAIRADSHGLERPPTLRELGLLTGFQSAVAAYVSSLTDALYDAQDAVQAGVASAGSGTAGREPEPC